MYIVIYKSGDPKINKMIDENDVAATKQFIKDNGVDCDTADVEQFKEWYPNITVISY